MGVRSAAGAKTNPSLVIVGILREGTFLEVRTWEEGPALVTEVVVLYFLGHSFRLLSYTASGRTAGSPFDIPKYLPSS